MENKIKEVIEIWKEDIKESKNTIDSMAIKYALKGEPKQKLILDTLPLNSRIVTIKYCIQDLEEILKESNDGHKH